MSWHLTCLASASLTRQTARVSDAASIIWLRWSAVGASRILCPDMAPFVDHRFDCRDLLQRGVIHYESERKASSAIIFAPIQGVTSGTVASVSRGPSEDRSSGLVSTQVGAFILDPIRWRPLSWRRA